MTNELLFYSEELKKRLQPQVPDAVVTVQRGLLLYRQDMVYRKVEEDATIKATVQDVVPCQVKLDLTFPSMSSCTCKQTSPCRHQLAVFFSAYSALDSISEWIQNWKSENPSASKNILKLQRAKELLQEEAKIEHTYEAWTEFMKETFKKQVTYSLYQPSYTLTTKWDTYMQRLKSKMPIESEWKLLYLFITYYHSFLFALESMEQKDISNSARYFLKKEVEDLTDRILYTMDQLTRITRPFAFDEYYQGIRNDMHKLLEGSSLSHNCLDLYRAIWTNLLKEKTWRKDELVLLKATLKKFEDSDENDKDYITIAAIHLAFLTGKNEDVQQYLNSVNPDDYPLIYYWVRHFDEQKNEPFISFVMTHTLNYLQSSANYYKRKEFVSLFIPYIKKYCQRKQRLDAFERYCEVCLPYSFVYYSRYLLECDKHRKWVELYLYNGIEFEYISTEELRVVQQKDPMLLLPLFTSIVNEKIENKNRQSYRAAVRYLKKIRTIYKKQKRLDQWDRYLERIQNSTKRLRAFQEELKRGKLIDAE